MEHFKLLDEAAGNGHIVHGLRVCEHFLKPVSQNHMELFGLEKTCRVIDSNHFLSTDKSTSNQQSDGSAGILREVIFRNFPCFLCDPNRRCLWLLGLCEAHEQIFQHGRWGGVWPLIAPKRKVPFPRYQVTLLGSGCQAGTEQAKFLVNFNSSC